jgi:Ferric iron reductase FhuF-like transporter
VTTVADPALVGPLAPITATLSAMRARRGSVATHGLAPGLVVADPLGWIPATSFANGDQLDALLDAAKQRWNAAPHAAAALAWKAYTYWLALPAVLGWASARRVPLLDPSRVLVRFTDHQPLLTLGLRRATVAVLPSDPLLALAAGSAPAWDLRVVADEAELLATLRHTLLDAHLTPVMDRIRERTHLGQRTLLGSVASGVAYGISRASDALPGPTAETVGTLLDALGVADLVALQAGRTGELDVQRNTCCLAFTLPEPKLCSGCCIRP